MAIRSNLGEIESLENRRAARSQRLQALSLLLPHVNAGITENVGQATTAPLGIRSPLIPRFVGPFSFITAHARASQTLFSFEPIQRFRAARTAEQAAQLSYNDALDVISLTVGNAGLQIIEAASRITAVEAQVQNTQAMYDQAVSDFRAGTSPKTEVTRSAVQLHTEQYNLGVACNNFEIVSSI